MFCVVFSSFLQLLQLIINNVHNDVLTDTPPELATAFDVLEFIVAGFVIFAIYKKNEKLLLPALALNLFFVCSFLIFTILYFVKLFSAEHDAGHRVLKLLIFVYFCIYQIWFTSVILGLYNYLKARVNKIKLLRPHIITNPNFVDE